MIAQVIKRAGEYLNAGADLVYPVGVLKLETITTLRKEISSPINILGSHRTIPLKTMQEIGINRVTFGPFVFRSALKKFVNIIEELAFGKLRDALAMIHIPCRSITIFERRKGITIS